MFTFEEKSFSHAWQRSAQRFDSDEGAIKAALDWVEACLLNGLSVAVRIVSVPA
jgi:hypothetical protein